MSEPVLSYPGIPCPTGLELLGRLWHRTRGPPRLSPRRLRSGARAYLDDSDDQDEEVGRATLDEAPVEVMAREAVRYVRQGMLADNKDLVAIGFALLEKLSHRLDRQAEEEF